MLLSLFFVGDPWLCQYYVALIACVGLDVGGQSVTLPTSLWLTKDAPLAAPSPLSDL